jgi:hypothetical protein
MRRGGEMNGVRCALVYLAAGLVYATLVLAWKAMWLYLLRVSFGELAWTADQMLLQFIEATVGMGMLVWAVDSLPNVSESDRTEAQHEFARV